ncbi:hypothetical protein CF327_g4524 [Tilletia walkeri]|nr:hypothetical protein CF327_g4524 [Tilletia walkeri]
MMLELQPQGIQVSPLLHLLTLARLTSMSDTPALTVFPLFKLQARLQLTAAFISEGTATQERLESLAGSQVSAQRRPPSPLAYHLNPMHL